jgi:hypothetical protein
MLYVAPFERADCAFMPTLTQLGLVRHGGAARRACPIPPHLPKKPANPDPAYKCLVEPAQDETYPQVKRSRGKS